MRCARLAAPFSQPSTDFYRLRGRVGVCILFGGLVSRLPSCEVAPAPKNLSRFAPATSDSELLALATPLGRAGLTKRRNSRKRHNCCTGIRPSRLLKRHCMVELPTRNDCLML